MHRSILWSLVLLLLPGALLAQRPTEAEVREVADRFHAALAAGDSLQVLSLLTPDAVVYEGGHAESREEYRSHHLASDIEFLQAVERETLREQVVAEGDGLALYLNEYRMSGRFRAKDVKLRGAETLVMRRTADGWRIRHIHWSSRRN